MCHINKGVCALGMSALLSVIAVLTHSAILFAALLLSNFIIVGGVPDFKGHENVWMFIVVAISSIPLNIYILALINECGFLFGSMFLLGILRCISYYSILFSVEEVIMGVITRMIWRRQYKLFL